MKKLYSIVLMAAALLVSTNAWAATHQVSTIGELETAWANAASGDVIQLTADMATTKIFWLGASTKGAAARSLTLDLNGKVLSDNVTGGADGLQSMFVISKGELNVITSVPGGQVVANSWQACGSSDKIQNVFFVTGTDDETDDPKNNSCFSHLTIGEGVTINASSAYGNAIVVDYLDNYWPVTSSNAVAAAGTTNYGTNTTANFRGPGWTNAAPYQFVQSGKSAQGTGNHYKRGNGVRVDVYGKLRAIKYGMKINGWVEKPANTNASPYIYIHNTADIWVPGTVGSGAVYASGYGRWLIEGKCEGAIGVNIKSGVVDVNDATIASNYTGNYTAPTGSTGVSAAGSAIVVQSSANTDYAGNMEVTISGDTKVTATNGYAIEENVTNKTTGTNVNVIEINGGTFDGGNVGTTQNPVEGTIVITAQTANSQSTTITVNGGQVNGQDASSAKVGNQTLADYLSSTGSDTHITYVDNGQGGTTMVISEGQAPSGMADFVSNADLSVKWTGASKDITGTFALKELEINEATAQVLTVKQGATFTVERVILGVNAQIIVEAGAKFIVTGEQGIVAPVVDNIVLKTEEGNPAIFLFHPSVTSNRHPNATVEFISKSYVDGSNYATQRFGVPTYGALTGIDAVDPDAPATKIRSRFYNFDYENNTWVTLGYINGTGSDAALDLAALNEAFGYYQMYNYRTTPGTKVIMKGKLVGNIDGQINVRGHYWNGFANSYLAPINGDQLIEMIPNTVQKAFYLYDVNQAQATWKPVTLDFMDDIAPMQPFLIRNTLDAAQVTVDYGDAVYYPTTGETKPGAAPARRYTANNITKVQIIVKGENNIDRVGVVESDEFSSEFDNGHEVEKYMNDGINMYVTADEKMGIYATDVLNNTYVGFQSVKGGKYTISFAKAQGAEYTLVDHETGAEVLMVEGNTYEFTAAANSANDYRFEIVSPRKVTTAIENAEAVKSAKGIYTITGQYMGEMNVWNSLPAGVYVVNGEKRVK